MLGKIKNPFRIVADFFKQIVFELKHVDYLSRSKTIRYTIFIVISLVLATIFLLIADKIFLEIRNLILQF